ncbi:RIIa domain-containing protein 1 isoform X2 [Protopterus annectens]|uniref:RIIa domain-containing protein 1 isoform X2 n=1 Tax=Protopterus annectens TaxID=7888 RepID=UPI001CFA2360|nr:RIIa domain-containing protein 1 isoform X2 [Protopterus annectens]
MAEIVTPWFGNADPGALSRVQQEKLRQFKINTRISNERYLRSHPEVELLVSDFVRGHAAVKDMTSGNMNSFILILLLQQSYLSICFEKFS